MSKPPPTAPSPAPDRARVTSPAQRRLDLLPLMYLAGFLVLAGALFYLWKNPAVPDGVAQEASRVDGLRQQVQDLATRVERAEARPASQAQPPVNLAPIEGRIAALEARPVPQPPDLSKIEERIAALEARPVPPAPGTVADLTSVAARLDAISGRQDALAGRQNTDIDGLTRRLDGLGADLNKRVDGLGSELGSKLAALDSRLGTVEQRLSQSTQQVSNVADRAARLARLQAAAAALETGQKLGELPGAPPALARFANQPPPTEAELRLSFPAAAEAAHKASQPAIEENQPLLNRTWIRAQQLVTVRQGERVLLGDPIAGVLARAKERLDAGDLAGTLKGLEGLAGPAAEAMQDWRGRAQALLDARAALAAQTAAAR